MPLGRARVADVGIDAVLFGNENVVLPDVGAAVEDRHHDGIGALEHFAAVGGRGELGPIITPINDLLAGAPSEVEALLVNVDERDLTAFQKGEGEQVANQTAREAKTAGADKDDLGHSDRAFP